MTLGSNQYSLVVGVVYIQANIDSIFFPSMKLTIDASVLKSLTKFKQMLSSSTLRDSTDKLTLRTLLQHLIRKDSKNDSWPQSQRYQYPVGSLKGSYAFKPHKIVVSNSDQSTRLIIECSATSVANCIMTYFFGSASVLKQRIETSITSSAFMDRSLRMMYKYLKSSPKHALALTACASGYNGHGGSTSRTYSLIHVASASACDNG
jgi:hypothetical protein